MAHLIPRCSGEDASRRIVLGLPDEAGRLAMLRLHSARMPTVGVGLEELARETQGFSPADLKALCQEAALAAMARGRPPTSEQDVSVSFPSTDAASAFAVAAAFGTRAPQLRAPLVLGATVGAAFRLLLGKHHATDVVAGALLGVAVGELIGREQ